jgi:4-hydroxy-2-oxoheptanedioate aldolase
MLDANMNSSIQKALDFRLKLRSGEMCVGAQMTLTDPAAVEIFGHSGYDFLVVDMEHAPHTPDTLRMLILAAEASPAVVIARPPRLDFDLIRLSLDLGAAGILCPFIETAAEVELLTSYTRYPPLGMRGYGPRRAGRYGLDALDYFETANDAVTCMAIIESRTAVDNMAGIAAVPGLDAICIGGVDLSIDLGSFGDYTTEAFRSSVEIAQQECTAHGVAFGVAAYDLPHAEDRVRSGDTVLLVGGDDVALRMGAARAIDTVRSARI